MTSPLAATFVLLVFAGALLAGARTQSATFDEPGHAAAGFSYWKTHDYRLDPENGILPQRWFGLALLPVKQAFPGPESAAWREANGWMVSDQWLNRMGNDAAALLARGRTAASVFAIALGVMVWIWSRQLFGATGGMLSLLLFVLSPTLLAHGALMTSDVAGALFFTVFLWCFQRMLERLSVGRVVLSAVALGCLFISKMSAVLAVPVAVALVAARVWDRRARFETPPPAARTGGVGVRRRVGAFGVHAPARLTLAAFAHVLIAMLIVWGAYGFRYAAHPPDGAAQSRFQYSWDELLETTGNPPTRSWPARIIAFAREHRLLPEAFLHGSAHVWKFSRGRGGFLNGEVTDSGRAWFFPFAFTVKTPLASFGVMALAFAALLLRRRSALTPQVGNSTPANVDGDLPPRSALLPLFLLLVVYWAAAITSDINIGLRHLMPTFPALFILCGAAGQWFEPEPTRAARGLRAALLLCVGTLVVEMAWWFPNYLAYFNGLVSPRRAYRHLIDSSLDWGQDLPALQRAIARRPAGEAQFLAYFGTASPRGHGIHARQIFTYPVGDRAESPPFMIIEGPQDDASLAAALQRLPDYDPRLVYPVQTDGKPASQLVKRASALQLTAGRYWISASLLQPVHYPQAYGAWSAQHEATYQRLREVMAPFLSETRATRVAALRQFPPAEWLRIIRDFEEFRFARLTACLRPREPDDHVNYSILAYDLDAAAIDRALNGPPP